MWNCQNQVFWILAKDADSIRSRTLYQKLRETFKRELIYKAWISVLKDEKRWDELQQLPGCSDTLVQPKKTYFSLLLSGLICYSFLLCRIKRCDVRFSLWFTVSSQFIEVQSTGKQNLANSWHILLGLWVFVRLSARKGHTQKRCSDRRLWTHFLQKQSDCWYLVFYRK